MREDFIRGPAHKEKSGESTMQGEPSGCKVSQPPGEERRRKGGWKVPGRAWAPDGWARLWHPLQRSPYFPDKCVIRALLCSGVGWEQPWEAWPRRRHSLGFLSPQLGRFHFLYWGVCKPPPKPRPRVISSLPRAFSL